MLIQSRFSKKNGGKTKKTKQGLNKPKILPIDSKALERKSVAARKDAETDIWGTPLPPGHFELQGLNKKQMEQFIKELRSFDVLNENKTDVKNYMNLLQRYSTKMSKGGKFKSLEDIPVNMLSGYPSIPTNDLLPFKKGGWIQKATTSIKRRGTEGVCTGDNFGGPSCRPGTKRYNLAKTFRAMAKKRKKQEGGALEADIGQLDNTVKQDKTRVFNPKENIGKVPVGDYTDWEYWKAAMSANDVQSDTEKLQDLDDVHRSI